MTYTVLRCIDCNREYGTDQIIYSCRKCGGLLEVSHDLDRVKVSKKLFDSRLSLETASKVHRSGVWRYKEIIHPLMEDRKIVSKPEGNTNLYRHARLSAYTGIASIFVKHEGENPTGSFKDRGMTVGVSEAVRQRVKTVACASTGNTSASLAAYASLAGLKSVVFIPEGKIAYGKLSQALAYGSRVLQIKGNFDDAMSLVQSSSREFGMYLLNSINPWRIEGQKSIMFELIQQLGWHVPDWVVFPAGNLGNTSAFGKALSEFKQLGLIDRMPRLAAIQASGSAPFYRTWRNKSDRLLVEEEPETIATAIKIGKPVSWKKALHALKISNGLVEVVSDQEIMDAKAIVDGCGIGCEPASASSVAGARKLLAKNVIKRDEEVACILTGSILKDPDATVAYHQNRLKGIKPKFANKAKIIRPRLEEVRRALV